MTGVLLLRDDVADLVEKIHDFATNAMLAVVALHLAGVFVSSILEKENLVRAMITGTKSAEPEQGIKHTYNWLALVMLAFVVAFGYFYLRK